MRSWREAQENGCNKQEHDPNDISNRDGPAWKWVVMVVHTEVFEVCLSEARVEEDGDTYQEGEGEGCQLEGRDDIQADG